MRALTTVLSLLALGLVGCVGAAPQDELDSAGLAPATTGIPDGSSSDRPDARTVIPEVGYTDTPLLPYSEFRVHDGNRPQPRMVLAGDQTSLPAPGAAPSDAIILFDGNDLESWTGTGGAARWKIERDAMEVNGTGDIQTRKEFGDIQLHLEFRTPDVVRGDSQGRGNSGVFLMERYEVQILDSWQNPTYPDGQAGALYGQRPPLVNASMPPGTWQCYDIVFIAPRFSDSGEVESPALVTLFHNGILVQHDQPFLGPTRHRTLPSYEAHPPRGPIRLQDHGNPMRFRNIWVRELDTRDE